MLINQIIKRVELELFGGSLIDDVVVESIALSKALTYRFAGDTALETPVKVCFSFNEVEMEVDETSHHQERIDYFHNKLKELKHEK